MLAEAAVTVAALAVAGVTTAALVRERRAHRLARQRAVELQQLAARLEAAEEERERLADKAMQATVLEQIDDQRAALLRSVSHDLRRPLATVRAVISDLQSGTAYDDATKAELLDLVADETERLDRLVANLLSMSRIEAGALQPHRQAVALDELVEHAVERMQRRLAGRRVQLDLPADLPLVDGDYTLVEQVVVNLLENAARYAPIGSTIHIGGRAGHDVVDVWVDDAGPGTLPFERHRLFEPFRRGEGSASSGIGLAICRAVVEAHHGAIHAEESPFGGARFRFSLPVRPERRPA